MTAKYINGAQRIMDYSAYINPLTEENRVYTREEIANMSPEEFTKNEKAIMLQLKFIGIPTEHDIQVSNEQNYEDDPTVEWVWVTQFIDGTCETCADLDGTTYETEDDAPYTPPIHENCHCKLIRTVKA